MLIVTIKFLLYNNNNNVMLTVYIDEHLFTKQALSLLDGLKHAMRLLLVLMPVAETRLRCLIADPMLACTSRFVVIHFLPTTNIQLYIRIDHRISLVNGFG